MNYKDPLVLILNITVILILILLIIPNLLNKKEKIGVRISFSIIFLIVIINCTGNLMIFYFENYQYLGIQFLLLFTPFLFGPAIYFYVKEINGSTIKKLIPHLIIPALVFGLGLLYNVLSDEHQIKIIKEISAGSYLPYNVLNTFIIVIPLFYFAKSKIWLNKLKIDEKENLYSQKKIKKGWAIEFLNYMIFSMFSFLIIAVVATYFLKIPQMYLDLVGMPIYFPIIYSIVAVRSNMISKDLEMQYVIAKVENENKLNEQRINISRDLHDNIGAYANSLIAKIDHIATVETNQNVRELGDLKENAEQILSLLRQTIWVLNNDQIAAETSFDYVKQYALKIFKNTSIKVKFEENIPFNKILTAAEASNIFRIMQEACQNIMKHSNASLVKISIESGNYFTISVEDNGKGFINSGSSESYGLENMKHRAKNIGMILKIDSKIAQGTIISVTNSPE